MNSEIFVALMLVAAEGAVMLLLPHYSPRRFLFAITVTPGFRTSEPARDALRRYCWELAGVMAVSALVVVLLQSRPELAFALGPGLLPVAGMAAYLRERAVVRRLMGPPTDVREADLTPEDDHLPAWFLLAIPPFAFPAAAALYLRSHWKEIPARVPVHWNFNGPDRWADKSVQSVYGTLLLAEGIMLLILLLTLGMFYGARRGPQRKAILEIIVAAIYLMSCIFSLLGVQTVFGFAPWWIFVPVAGFLLFAIPWTYRLVHELPGEQTPDECWYWGQVYVNRQDPAIFVQRRVGFGYTFNLGNPWAWIILGVFLAAIPVMLLIFR